MSSRKVAIPHVPKKSPKKVTKPIKIVKDIDDDTFTNSEDDEISEEKPVTVKSPKSATKQKVAIPKPVSKPKKPVEKKVAEKPSLKIVHDSYDTSLSDDNFTHFEEEMLEIFGDEETIRNVRARLLDAPLNEDCTHEVCFDADGLNICKECGCEVESLDFQPEWRFYGSSDNRNAKDPSRCHSSAESNRGGIDDVFTAAKLNHLSLAIRKKTEAKYRQIVGKETLRGKGRKSTVAACLLFTFRDEGDVRTSDDIRKLFELKKQEMSEGLTKYLAVFPNDRLQHIKPSDLIRRIMHQTKIDFRFYKYVLRMAKALEKVDYTLNHSSPQSVASAIVYLYLCLTPSVKENLGLTKTKFAREVGLSDITISKLVKKAAEIIGLSQLDL